MREIKFRAWGKEKPQDESPKMLDMTWLWPMSMRNLSENKFVFMQYTGLKDKNGKEIYEGDIVKFPKQWWSNGDKEFEIREIEFEHGTFSFFNDGDWSVDNDDMEIVGNIYETTNLIEKNESK